MNFCKLATFGDGDLTTLHSILWSALIAGRPFLSLWLLLPSPVLLTAGNPWSWIEYGHTHIIGQLVQAWDLAVPHATQLPSTPDMRTKPGRGPELHFRKLPGSGQPQLKGFYPASLPGLTISCISSSCAAWLKPKMKFRMRMHDYSWIFAQLDHSRGILEMAPISKIFILSFVLT